MDRRQYLNVTSTPAGKNGPSAQDRYCARGLGGGAKKRRKKSEINLVFVTIMLQVLTYVISNKLFL